MNWFARLFGRAAPKTDAHAPAAHDARAIAAPPAPAPAPESPPDIDLAFFHWLAGPHVKGAPVGGNLILDELARLGRDPEDAASLVPRVPAVIPQLLHSLRDEGSSSMTLARLLAQDAVLVAEVIREVNSPFYKPATPVRNLEGALLLLGQNGLRMLLARVAFRPIINMQTGPLARHVAPALWRHSGKSALAASLLAPRLGADPFEAYLAGLMHDVGLVVAFRVIDGLVPAGALPDDDAFGRGLIMVARRISARIATQWALPAPIGHAIVHIGDAGALPATLAAADRLAKLRMLAGSGQPAFVHAATLLGAHELQVYQRLDDQSDQE